MELIRGAHNLKKEHRGCVVTIGSFDGIHLGHQQLLKKITAQAKQHSLPSCAITFEPQPNEFFHNEVPPRITRLRGKLIAFKQYGVDRVLCLRFNQALAQLSAQDFVEEILVQGLAAKHIVIGDDFRFGAKRQGDINYLKSVSAQHNFTVESTETFELNGMRVSSTKVREALDAGDLDAAEILLGRRYAMSGRVAHGDKRGRLIGFPTANIFLHRKAVPIRGVYCVQVSGLGGGYINGVANVGNRPTVGGNKSLLEVHLFDFNRDIYGEHVHVEFVKKLRDEKKYDSFELLKDQIMKDAEQGRAYFSAGAV